MSAGRPPAPRFCRRPRREVVALIWLKVLLLVLMTVAGILLKEFGYLATP